MSQSIPPSLLRSLRVFALGFVGFTLLLLPAVAVTQPGPSDDQGSLTQSRNITPDLGVLLSFSSHTLATTNTPIMRYFYTFWTGALDDADFTIWGGARSTSCGIGCSYDQNIVSTGNPGGALALHLDGTNGKGGAGPRQNGVSLSTATYFEYSADFYVVNGQLDARYGLVFDATSGTFPGSGDPPMDPNMNYYLLELRMDAVTRTKVSKWQFLRVINGGRQALTTATDLPVSINQGQWHNLRVVQQGSTLSFYLNGQFVASTQYDSTWGDNRRRFGLYIDVRAANGDNGPFEFFTDNVAVIDFVAPNGVEIDGPETGEINTAYLFKATAAPISTTTPITYVWEATDQIPVVHSSDRVTASASFAWPLSGTKTITVTALNVVGSVVATHSLEVKIGPTGLELAGPPTGVISETYAFTATTSPITVTTPITYVWQATDQDPMIHASDLITDFASFAWTISGTKIITVTAVNGVSAVTTTHAIEFSTGPAAVEITGPRLGATQSAHVFTATTAPISVTTPITYVWEATDQTSVIHSSELITDSVSFAWPGSGTKVITVTTLNVVGAVTAMYWLDARIEPAGIEIAGPPLGAINATYLFTATTAPITVTTPITYLWQATDQIPVIHSSDLMTDSVSFVWAISGMKTITITAWNVVGAAAALHSFEVRVIWKIFLPTVLKRSAGGCFANKEPRRTGLRLARRRR